VLYLAEDAYLSWKLASKMLTQCEDEAKVQAAVLIKNSDSHHGFP
jgi:hypothetical protein